MINEQLAPESCLQKDQSGRESVTLEAGLERGMFVPLTEEDAARALAYTDSTILPPEVVLASGREGGAESGTVQLSPPPITRVFQGRAVTPFVRARSDIRAIVIHTPEGGQQGTLDVLNGTRASFDFYMPLNGELYRCNDYLKHIAWQAGDWHYNQRSIGIEQGDFAAKSGQFPDDHYRRLAYLVAYLIQTTNTPLQYAKAKGQDGIIDHSMITPDDRTDPGVNFKRQHLLDLVKGYLSGAEQLPWVQSGSITWVRGELKAGMGAVARREPKRENNIMRNLVTGNIYTTDGFTDAGESVVGSSRWYHLSEAAGYGWVHSSGGTHTQG